MLCSIICVSCTVPKHPFLINEYTPLKTEWDGRFLYVLAKDKTSCLILGTEPILGETTKNLDTLYLPSHYKGIPITGYCGRFGGWDTEINKAVSYEYGIDITPVKELYLPCVGLQSGLLGESNYEKLYNPYIRADAWYESSSAPHLELYIPTVGYEDEFNGSSKYYKGYAIIETNSDYSFSIYYYNKTTQIKTHKVTIYKANTAYMFNYENAPNQNYYFINNFERGGLIENTPYEPYREGYAFLGWYKDSDCTEIWDFETDTLPIATYDENGELEFVETRLYAKWGK